MKTILLSVFIVLSFRPTVLGVEGAAEFVMRWEGFSAEPYADGAQKSIGYGTDTRWMEKHGFPTVRISKKEAELALRHRLAIDTVPRLRGRVPNFDSLPPAVRVALVSAFYNCEALIGPNLRGYIAQGDWDRASYELALGHRPKGRYGLVRRRFAEANLLRSAHGLAPFAVPKSIAEFHSAKAEWL